MKIYGRKKHTTVRSILLAAARILSKYGWCRGDNERGKRHCLIGSILAVPSSPNPKAHALQLMRSSGYGEYWNDQKCRNRRQVIAVLRRVARAS